MKLTKYHVFLETTADVDWNTSSFDWSQSSKRIEEDKLELNWDDDEMDEGEDADSPPMSMKLDKKEQDNVHKSENDNSKTFLFFLCKLSNLNSSNWESYAILLLMKMF